MSYSINWRIRSKRQVRHSAPNPPDSPKTVLRLWRLEDGQRLQHAIELAIHDVERFVHVFEGKRVRRHFRRVELPLLENP